MLEGGLQVDNDEKLLVEFLKDVDILNEIEANVENFNVLFNSSSRLITYVK